VKEGSSGGSISVAQIEYAPEGTGAITAPLDRPKVGGTNGENAAHASIFLVMNMSTSPSAASLSRGPERTSRRCPC
jgi:hypothetical protein